MEEVKIGGICLRKEGKDKAVVLVEVDGEWKRVIEETWALDGECEISHCVAPSEIAKSKIDIPSFPIQTSGPVTVKNFTKT
jgi:hypothetical protein